MPEIKTQIGQCEFCERQNIPLVAALAADPDQRVCTDCHADVRIPTVRPLNEIAREIRRNWPKPYFGAVPYLEAMGALDSVNDRFGCDDARGIVLYFLSNASTWRGDVAKRIKLELKGMVK